MKISSILITLVTATNMWATASSECVGAGVGPGVGQGTCKGSIPGGGVGVGAGAGQGAGQDTGQCEDQGSGKGTGQCEGQGEGQGTDQGSIPGAGAGVGAGTGQEAGQGTGHGEDQGADQDVIPDADAGPRLDARLGADVVDGNGAAKTTCPTSGFGYSPLPASSGCLCNFAGACDMNGTPTAAANQNPNTLTGFAPQGMDNFALAANGVNTICEGDTVAILYDCNARIPLYAATVIDGTIAKGPFNRKTTWQTTNDPQLLKKPNFSATNNDYTSSNTHVYCYEDATGKLLNWDGSKCTNTAIAIHKGHMIAASYGQVHGGQTSVDATFTYTNAVPQIGSFNSGQWNAAEKSLINWALACQSTAQASGLDAKIYVVVGVIPSSFLGKPRFFGEPGFGDLQGMAPNEYRLSFPEIMWTAGCCMYTDGTVAETYAFWGFNRPNKDKVSYHTTPTQMFTAIQSEIIKTWPAATFTPPIVFPNQPACN